MPEMKLMPFIVHAVENETAKLPYGPHLMEVPELREKTGEHGNGIVVAILDTGVDINHIGLKDNIIFAMNFTHEGRVTDVTDGSGHGTHVAGIIKSVAPEVSLLICKVLDSRGSGTYDSIINGIEYATHWRGPNNERVRVINMSLGGPMDDPRLEKSILDACAAGILVVVASGNEGDNNPETFEYSYPSSYNECVTVAACDENAKIASFSNEHLQVDVIAPGVRVLSTFPNNRYAVLSGTSMATPFVSGAFALIVGIGEKQFRRELTESELYALLVKTCCSLGYKKSTEGNGLPKLTHLLKECGL